MIKEILNILVEKNYNILGLKNRMTEVLNYYTEEQLFYMLKDGLNINGNEFELYYVEGIGFRCHNTDKHINGNKPVCNIIEKNLNERIIKYKL